MREELKLFLLALGFLFALNFTTASEIDDLKSSILEREAQIKEIEAEIAAYEKQIEAKEAEANTLKNQIAKQDAILKQLGAQLRLTQSKIASSKLILNRLSLEIGERGVQIEDRRTALSEILRSINEADDESLLEILLKHSDFSDFFGDVEQIQNLESAVKDDLNAIEELKTQLEESKAEEEATKKNLERLNAELKDRNAIESNVKKTKSQLLVQTKNKEAEYQRLVREREKQRAAVLDEVRKIEDQLRLLIDPLSLPARRPGVLGWPVANPIITQSFGSTSFAKVNSDVYGGKGHNGIDLKAPIGTPIFASEDGVVKSVGNSDLVCPGGSYGRWVLIEHPNRLATLYAHLSHQKVSQGQEVKRGELIGYGGDTGYTTGPHLHFTLYDARTVEFRKSRVCGTLPYGGYLDPTIYL